MIGDAHYKENLFVITDHFYVRNHYIYPLISRLRLKILALFIISHFPYVLSVVDAMLVTTKTSLLMRDIMKYAYVMGLRGIWIEDNIVQWPDIAVRAHRYLAKFLNVAISVFIVLLYGSFYTQTNLSEQQKFDRFVYIIAFPFLHGYYVLISHREDEVKQLIGKLVMRIESSYTNEDVEMMMLRKIKMYVSFMSCGVCMAVLMYGWDGLLRVLVENGTFVTAITAWPDIHDTSPYAGVARVVFYVITVMYGLRTLCVLILAVVVNISTSHQYTQLHSYFSDMSNIFQNDGSQQEKEAKYEEALKIGIKLHNETIKNTRELERIFSVTCGLHIVVNVAVVAILMIQMTNADRTFTKVASVALVSVGLLTTTGLFMWTLGDVTVEASDLATGIFFSGWENCQGRASLRVRKLVFRAMIQAQKPIVVRTLVFITVSYESFVSIVRASYTIFSVLY